MVKIASVGDCCIDFYPQTGKAYLGGTAFNRAAWLASHGEKTYLVSAVGTDDWGKEYLSACNRLKINTRYLSVLPGKTSHVRITLNQKGEADFSAWKLGVLKNFYPPMLPNNCQAIITSGFKPIKQLLTLPKAPFLAADFDGNTPYTLSPADTSKLAAGFDLIVKSSKQPMKPGKNQMILYTLGKDGSRLLFGKKEFFTPAAGFVPDDSTGAGDVYLASFVLKYLKNQNLPLAMKSAAKAAAAAITSPRNLSV